MFISKKKHKEIIITCMKDQANEVAEYKKRILALEDALKEAKDFKDLFNKVAIKFNDCIMVNDVNNCFVSIENGFELKLPENVPVYVEDMLGGKVIRQESIPVTKLDKKGKATYGYTKAEPTKGREYLLIQD